MKRIETLLVVMKLAMGGHVSASAQTPGRLATDSPPGSSRSAHATREGASCCAELPPRFPYADRDDRDVAIVQVLRKSQNS